MLIINSNAPMKTLVVNNWKVRAVSNPTLAGTPLPEDYYGDADPIAIARFFGITNEAVEAAYRNAPPLVTPTFQNAKGQPCVVIKVPDVSMHTQGVK